MGLKDFFSSGRGKSQADKLIKSTINRYGQSVDRYAAMERLLELGGKDDEQATACYIGLLRRFTITSTKSIEDEEEKGWVYSRLSALGKPVLPAIKQFCLEFDNIAWALRILEDVANEDEEWEIIDALVKAHPPGFEGGDQKKLQFLAHVQDIDDPKVTDILLRYLGDADEPVRFSVVEALIDIADERALDQLAQHLGNPKEDSIRLRTRLLDGLAQLGWDLSAHKDTVVANLGNEHSFDGTKIIRR